ncbi:unnamed protein product, partial [Cochlearia groenlandica]
YHRNLKSTSSKDNSEIQKLQGMMQQLLKDKRNVNSCEEVFENDDRLYDENDGEGHEDVNFIRGQGKFEKRYHNPMDRNNNMSYRNNNVENPQFQKYPAQGRTNI